MKHLVYSLAFLILLPSCSNEDSAISNQLLQPNAQKAKEFVEQVKKNDRFLALALVNLYEDRTSPERNNRLDSQFIAVQLRAEKHKLKPMDKWSIVKDELRSRSGNYSVVYEEVLVPFDWKATDPDDPVYLSIGFEMEHADLIEEFGIVTKRMCQNGNDHIEFDHYLSQKQYRRLNN